MAKTQGLSLLLLPTGEGSEGGRWLDLCPHICSLRVPSACLSPSAPPSFM